MELIAKPALERAEIKLSTKISRIDTSKTSVTVFTDDGHEHHYNEVVMTTPLGWLKLNKQAFVPPLPPRFAQAVDAIGYGCLEKVLLQYDRCIFLTHLIIYRYL